MRRLVSKKHFFDNSGDLKTCKSSENLISKFLTENNIFITYASLIMEVKKLSQCRIFKLVVNFSIVTELIFTFLEFRKLSIKKNFACQLR